MGEYVATPDDARPWDLGMRFPQGCRYTSGSLTDDEQLTFDSDPCALVAGKSIQGGASILYAPDGLPDAANYRTCSASSARKFGLRRTSSCGLPSCAAQIARQRPGL